MIPLPSIIHSQNINILSNDTQLILSLTDKTSSTQIKFNVCMIEIAHWIKTSCLKLNIDKTKIMIFGKSTSSWDSNWWLTEQGPPHTPTTQTKKICIVIKSILDMTAQVIAVTELCFHTLKLLRKVLKCSQLAAAKRHACSCHNQAGLREQPLSTKNSQNVCRPYGTQQPESLSTATSSPYINKHNSNSSPTLSRQYITMDQHTSTIKYAFTNLDISASHNSYLYTSHSMENQIRQSNLLLYCF